MFINIKKYNYTVYHNFRVYIFYYKKFCLETTIKPDF